MFGKGRKERRVPMSIELRRILYRFGQVKERAEVVCLKEIRELENQSVGSWQFGNSQNPPDNRTPNPMRVAGEHRPSTDPSLASIEFGRRYRGK